MNTVKKIILICVLGFCAFYLTVQAGRATQAVINGIYSCVNVIIPSLFGFIVLSQLVIGSGIYTVIFKPLYFIFGKLLGLNEELFSVFIMSLIGGYPVGACLLKNSIAYNKCYNEIAHKMICYCCCGSPGFILSIFGSCVYGNIQAGALIYFTNVLTCLIMAIILRQKKSDEVIFHKNEKISSSDLIINSVLSAMRSLMLICGVVIIFALITSMLDYIGLFNLSFISENSGIVKAFLEISNITAPINPPLLPVAASLSSFGGMCIMLQVISLMPKKIDIRLFLLTRIPVIIINYVLCSILMRIFNISAKAYAVGARTVVMSEVNVPASLCLIAMTLLLLKLRKSTV